MKDATDRFPRERPPLLAAMVLGLAGTILIGTGCERRDANAHEKALYGSLTPAPSAAPVAPPPAPRFEPATNVLLSAIETSLSPATLWHSREQRLSFFAGMPATGLGAVTFLSYSSPTGIAIARPGQAIEGSEMRENWILAGFAGAEGWTEWDSPWAAFFQRRPRRVRLDADGVHVLFAASAGYVALMPLYGYYKPPQHGHEGTHSWKDKELRTWEWPIAVARDPLARLRFWAGATRRFPIRADESVIVHRGNDAVILRENFTWLEIPDEWGTQPIRVAPVSPTLGLTLTKDQKFPVQFSSPPMDFELPTPYGPFFGVRNADGYDITLRVLRKVNETEAPTLPDPARATPAIREALEKLRAIAHATLNPGESRPAAGDEGASSVAPDHPSLAKAIPYLEEPIRTQAIAGLKRYFHEALEPTRFRESEIPPGSGRRYLIPESGDSGKFLQALWAYAHVTGDYGLIRDRWSMIQRLFVPGVPTRWVGFGPTGSVSSGDETTAIAYARLAYLAGDLPAYEHACSEVARRVTREYVRTHATPWFLEQQPWHSMKPIEGNLLTELRDGLSGWGIGTGSATGIPAKKGESGGADVLTACLETLQSTQPVRFERLIPGAPPSAPFNESHPEGSGADPALLQHVVADSVQGGWPRITWPEWKTLKGDAWNFGVVRAGTNTVPERVWIEPLSRNSVVIQVADQP